MKDSCSKKPARPVWLYLYQLFWFRTQKKCWKFIKKKWILMLRFIAFQRICINQLQTIIVSIYWHKTQNKNCVAHSSLSLISYILLNLAIKGPIRLSVVLIKDLSNHDLHQVLHRCSKATLEMERRRGYECKLPILCKYLIPRFRSFESNCENIKSQAPIFSYNFILPKNSQKNKSDLLAFREFTFTAINSSPLIRNL